jgi:hypothetical protein
MWVNHDPTFLLTPLEGLEQALAQDLVWREVITWGWIEQPLVKIATPTTPTVNLGVSIVYLGTNIKVIRVVIIKSI